jgi:hypothetical protein
MTFKKQKEQPVQPKPLEVGEIVLTPISDRPGRITKIEISQIAGAHIMYVPETGRITSSHQKTTYHVQIEFPHRDASCFKKLTGEFSAGELKRP